jgi:two-component system sensor histidine kinase UhpB
LAVPGLGSVHQGRSAAQDLRPADLDAGSLPDQIANYVEAFALRSGLEFELDLCDLPNGRLDQAAVAHVFRVMQEALGNARRHALAQHIRVSLSLTSRELVLEIADDGVGIPEGTARASGMGLETMRERAELIGGALHVTDATPGTRVRLIVPVAYRRG